jgi:hypothetical protein
MMLRAVLAALVVATAYCGVKGAPQPPIPDSPDAGAAAGVPDGGAP